VECVCSVCCLVVYGDNVLCFHFVLGCVVAVCLVGFNYVWVVWLLFGLLLGIEPVFIFGFCFCGFVVQVDFGLVGSWVDLVWF